MIGSALVTGHRGFVGRHLYQALRHAGWEAVGVDLSLGTDCRALFRSNAQYDLVVHCAANVGGRAAIDGNPLWVADDFSIDAEMFRWAARVKPRRVVYFSSSAAYPVALQGQGDHRRLAEDDIDLTAAAEPDAIYGWVKLTGERLAARLRDEGVPVTVLRPFSGYGTDQSFDYPFPSFVRRAKAHDDPFEIWGSGEQVRDWVHVEDVVATTLTCIEEGIDGPLNIGSGVPTSFYTLANMVSTAAGYRPRFDLKTEAPTGVHWRVADVERSHAIHHPKITLEEGIARALGGDA